MSADTIDRENITDSMILTVILIATIYWFLDSVLNIFFSNKFNLIAELIGPDLYDIYIRLVVLCLFIIFGSHAQSIINKLKSAQKELNDSEELWRSLVETAPDVIATVDRNGLIRFINKGFASVPSDKAIGKSLYSFLPPLYRDLARDSIESVFRTGDTESFEIRSGDRRNPTWSTYRVGPLQLSGKVIAATIISSNTTEFKRAEELMRYKELFDNVSEGVFIITPKGKFIECNDRVLNGTGYSKAELLKMRITKFIEKDQIPFVENMMRKVRRDKEARFELNIKTKGGSSIPNEVNCRYINYLGEPCFLCVARDITKTKMLHSQLIRSERLAATGQLAASIAHEINSPLQGISSLLNVTRTKYKHDPDLLRKLDLIKNAFGSIRDTVRNLIDLNRPGKEKKQPMDVNQVIENTVALVRSHMQKSLVKTNLNLTAKASSLKASPQQLGQVLMNLINNAVEAIASTPEYQEKHKTSLDTAGEVTIETFNQNDDIVILIKDTGPGISEKDLNHIFDPFFTRKKTMGMGVGLSICHGIIADHKGIITAENAPEGGAAFTITLPRT